MADKYNENIVNENCLEWLRYDREIAVTLCGNNRFANRVRKLAKEYPDEVKIIKENEDGSIFAKIPLSYLGIRRPASRQMTEEEREKALERLKKARDKQKEMSDES